MTPLCSIVIPVVGDLRRIPPSAAALAATPPPVAHEVLVVARRTDADWSGLGGVDVVLAPDAATPAAACNRGVSAATGRLVAFLDPDTIPDPGWLEALISSIDMNSGRGVVGSKLLYDDGTIAHAGIVFGPHAVPFRTLPYRLYRGFRDGVITDRARNVPAVIRPGMLLRRETLLALGGFDETYRRGLDDVDLCLRARRHGLGVHYTPVSVLRRRHQACRDALDDYDGDARMFETKWAPLIADDEFYCRQDGVDVEDVRAIHAGATRPGPSRPARRRGVVWSAALFDTSGYADEARSAGLALHEAGVPVFLNGLQPARRGPGIPQAMGERLVDLCTRDLPDPFVHVAHFDPGQLQRSSRAVRSIGRTMCESDGIPPEWVAACNAMDEVWVPCAFNVETFAGSGVEPAKLVKVPEGLPTELYEPSIRPLRLPEAAFTFLSVFAWKPRKGWDVLVRAYVEEFRRVENTQLVLKISPEWGQTALECREEMESVVRALGRDPATGPRILFIEADLDVAEMPRLYRAADAFVLPSRGEGWGRPYMEAMAMGLPTIGTRWSGQLEFMTDDNSFLIDCDVVDVPGSAFDAHGRFRGHRWAEPSVEHLRTLLRTVYEDRSRAAERGARGREHILEHHSLAALGADLAWHVEAAHEAAVRVGSIAPPRPPTAPSTTHVTPIVWSGFVEDATGYAEETRIFLAALDRAKAPLLLRPARPLGPPAGLPHPFVERLRQLAAPDLPDTFVHVLHAVPSGLHRDRRALRSIARTMFETDRLPPQWVAKCNEMDEVWVPTDFNLETFARSGVRPDKLFKVPSGLDTRLYDPSVPPLPLDDVTGFTFLSVLTWEVRKGWDVLVKAYREAFAGHDDVTLALKVNPTSGRTLAECRDELDGFLRAQSGRGARDAPRIVVLDADVTVRDMPRLYLAADAFVLASRGEGWGRPYMEAMAMGLPTIGTRWSGQLEFMTDDNSFLIDCDVTDIPESGWREAFRYGHRWAEPSVEHLSALLRTVYDDRGAAAERGARARESILARYTLDHVAGSVVERLSAASSAAPARPAVVRWEGDTFANHSLANVNRALCRVLLRSRDVNLQLRTAPTVAVGVAEEPDTPALLALARPVAAQSPPDVWVRHLWPPNFEPPLHGHWVLMQPWEFGSLPRDWVGPINDLVDEVWVPTTFVREGFVRSGVDPDRVVVVPNGIDPDRFHPAVPPAPLNTNKGTVFLFVGGTLARKGIDILLEVYLETFTAADDVCLVVKDFGTDSVYRGQGLGQWVRAAQRDPRNPEILYTDEELPAAALASLYTACDALVAPYRAEGFCLPVAEAMACGLAVIVPDFGACLDYCDPAVARLVPSAERRLPEARLGPFALTERPWCAEVDRDALAGAMRWVADHPDEARRMGQAAAAKIHRDFSWHRAAERATERIRAVTARPVRRSS